MQELEQGSFIHATFRLMHVTSRISILYQPWCMSACDLLSSMVAMQGQKLHKRTGTPLYMAPELFMQYFGLESDMWALGILLYQVR